MTYRIIIRPEAEKDLSEGFDWYEHRRNGLGFEFLNEVSSLLQKIKANPQRHPEVYRGARMGFTKRFPYRVLYLFEQEQIEVLCVINVRRDPALWKARL